ncbi:Uncharacterised protein [Mycobacteroides abscessus subsp. abscessus]|nr:Uncharacterised protein [Mycobacteroides abscessus subsp. abscessus]
MQQRRNLRLLLGRYVLQRHTIDHDGVSGHHTIFVGGGESLREVVHRAHQRSAWTAVLHTDRQAADRVLMFGHLLIPEDPCPQDSHDRAVAMFGRNGNSANLN